MSCTDFVNCNLCYASPSSEINIFYITSCFHIFCSNCENGGSANCKLCSKACKLVKISPDMPLDFRKIFMDVYKEAMELMESLMFQQQNYKLIINQYLPHLEGKYLLLKETLVKGAERQKELEKQLRDSKETIKVLSDENELLRRKLWHASPPIKPLASTKGSPSTPGLPVLEYKAASDFPSGQRPSSTPMIEALRQTRYNTSATQQSMSGQYPMSPLEANISSRSWSVTPSRLNLNRVAAKDFYKNKVLPSLKPSFKY